MANSTSNVPQIAEGVGAVAAINELFDAASQTTIGGRWAAGITGPLVFAVLGGRASGVNGSNTAVTLTASTTNYIVRKKSDGVVSTATTTTNWNDSTNYWRLYSVITGTTAVTSYTDERLSSAGLFGGSVGGAAASVTQSGEMMAGYIGTITNKTFKLVVKAAHGGTITEATTISESGTCTATWKINTTALGGTANSVSTTEQSQAHSSANVFTAGDDIQLTVSSNATCLGMSFTLKYTRTLD